jgi:hypothetical protein
MDGPSTGSVIYLIRVSDNYRANANIRGNLNIKHNNLQPNYFKIFSYLKILYTESAISRSVPHFNIKYQIKCNRVKLYKLFLLNIF